MDTKSKKFNCFLSFLSFFLSVSIFASGIALGIVCAANRINPIKNLSDAYASDYQKTESFQWRVSSLMDSISYSLIEAEAHSTLPESTGTTDSYQNTIFSDL